MGLKDEGLRNADALLALIRLAVLHASLATAGTGGWPDQLNPMLS